MLIIFHLYSYNYLYLINRCSFLLIIIIGGDGTAICIIYPVLYSQRNSPSISHTSTLSYYTDQQCFKMLAIYQVFRQQMTRANCWTGEDSNFSTLFLKPFPVKAVATVLGKKPYEKKNTYVSKRLSLSYACIDR